MKEDIGLDLRPDVTVDAHGTGMVREHPPGGLDQGCIDTHLTCYDLSLSEIRRFRRWKSGTLGHRERGVTPKVGAVAARPSSRSP